MTIRAFTIREYVTQQTSSERTSPKDSNGFARVLKQARQIEDMPNSAGSAYTVRPGDALYRIARQLKTSHNLSIAPHAIVRELTDLNNISNPNRIYPGQVLHIPARFTNTGGLDNTGTAPALSTTKEGRGSADSLREHDADEVKTFPPLFAGDDVHIQPLLYEEKASITTTAEFIEHNESVAETTPPEPAGPPRDLAAQIAMYKEDQLLAHPGGDNYFLNRATVVFDTSFDQSRFANRVGKDLSDAGENLINLAKDLTLGSQYKYVGQDGDVLDGQRVGLLGAVKNFFEDLLSGLSFGAYMPGSEKAPEGAGASVLHFVKKVFYEAPIKNLLVGVPHAGVNVFKDAALAALNLLEVVPDATIGNFEWGQKATTTVFDNGQVVIDYLTDILPGSNAWLRVRAAGADGEIAPPVIFSLQTTEQGITDSRWATVRNTPFRKTIETVGGLLSDAFIVVAAATQLRTTSADHQRQ